MGFNKVLPNAIRALHSEQRFMMFQYISLNFDENVDNINWNKSNIVPVSYKGDQSNPSTWREDATSK